MSTLAVTKRETNSWRWPIIQFVFMEAMAYLSAFGCVSVVWVGGNHQFRIDSENPDGVTLYILETHAHLSALGAYQWFG